jgi:hypothetical protein
MTAQIINIDLCYLADSQPSICIPRVFNNISEDRIRRVFDELSLGRISAVDIKERRSEKGESFKSVYVHFDKWFWTENAQTTRKKLISGKEVKIVYDNPWFWKVSASKYTHLRDYEIGTTIHKQLQVNILDNKVFHQVIDEFYSELMSHKLSGKEYNEHYKRISDAKERFYFTRELNHNTKECNNDTKRDYDRRDTRRDYDKRDYDRRNTKERDTRRDYDRRDTRERDYDRRETRERDYDRRDTRERDYDRRETRERDYDRRDYDRRDYDRRDTRERDYDRRDTRERDYDRRSDSRERDYDRRSDSRDRDYDRRSDCTPSVPLTNQIIPTKRFKLKVKNKPEPLKTKVNAVSLEIKKEKELELEEGEIEETELNVMTEEKKQILEDLYGDLNC